MADEDLQRLAPAVRAVPPLRADRSLFENGDTAGQVFVVRAGCLRTSNREAHGAEQVLGFHLPGDVIGFGAAGAHFPGRRAVALERSTVCAIHLATVHGLAARLPGIAGRLQALLERAMTAAEEHALFMGRRTAPQRLALFLLTWSRRRRAAGFCATDLDLPMSREDLACYLGLVTETTSRALSRLHGAGLIEVIGRHHVRLADPPGLAALAGVATGPGAGAGR